MNHIDPELDGATRGVGREPGKAMGMQVQRELAAGGLDRRHQRLYALGRQQTARVLQINGVDAEGDQLTGLASVVVVGVNRAVRVNYAASGIEADFLGCAHRNLHVAHIVEGVIRRVIAHAVGEDALRGEVDNIVGEEFESEQTLAACHHNQRCVPDPFAENAHALPRILAKVAHADVEHRAADQVDGCKTGAVEPRGEVGHHRRGHTRRPKTLRRVAQGHIDELNGSPFAHQLAAIWKFSSIQRVWTSARANSGCCRSCAWN